MQRFQLVLIICALLSLASALSAREYDQPRTAVAKWSDIGIKKQLMNLRAEIAALRLKVRNLETGRHPAYEIDRD